MIDIEGSFGEGGGQILRTSLSLSMITGKPFRIRNIRAERSQPGLRAQHLSAVQAAGAITRAETEGAQLHSRELVFTPGEISSGNYEFEIPTAGAAGLVLQTIFIPLTYGRKKSHVRIVGGTHVPWSPCFHYLAWHWLIFLRKIGLEGDLQLKKAGYYPVGGGEISADIQAGPPRRPLIIQERGSLKWIRGLSGLSNLPDHINRRQRNRVVQKMGARFTLQDIRTGDFPSPGPGTFMLLLAEFEHSQACFFALGKKGLRAEEVSDQVVAEMENFLSSNGVVDDYLADQLMLPLALSGGPSKIKLSRVTEHMTTNAYVIEAFLPVRFCFNEHLLTIEP